MCRKLIYLVSFVLLVTFGVTTLALSVPLPSGFVQILKIIVSKSKILDCSR